MTSLQAFHRSLSERATESVGRPQNDRLLTGRVLSASLLFISALSLSVSPLSLTSSPAFAELALNTLDPNFIEQGEEKEFILIGRDFSEDASVSFSVGGSGGEVTVVGSVELVLGTDAGDGRGDRLVFTARASGSAPTGACNVTVSSGGMERTKFAALNIRPGSGTTTPNPEPVEDPNDVANPGNGGGGGSLYDDLPEREAGRINIITRASPPKGEKGGQVNLWIEGREFPSDVTIKFSGVGENDILPAPNINGELDPPQIYRNTSDTNGEMDGILYYIRISAVAEETSNVSITLSSPSSGSYTQDNVFEIVPEGQGFIFDDQGAEDIEAVTSASPRAVRAGRNVAMWILGEGFNINSEIEYSNPALSQVIDSEVVINAQNAPGYDGIRSYLLVPPTAPPGMVSVTVTNPNGTSQQGIDLFEVVPPANLEGGPIEGGGGSCVDDETDPIVSEIVLSSPSELYLGQETELRIYARGIACRAIFLLYGGGVEILTEPQVFQDTSDPTLRFFKMNVKVNVNAPLGPRSVTLINPNGSSKSREDAFTIVAGRGGAAGAACQQDGGQHGALIIFALLALMRSQRRRDLA